MAYSSHRGWTAWAPTINEAPLDWCFRPGLKLDFRGRVEGPVVDAAEMVAPTGPMLAPFDIMLANTAAGAVYRQPDDLSRGCGIGRAATLWLLEQGVRVTETDGWS